MKDLNPIKLLLSKCKFKVHNSNQLNNASIGTELKDGASCLTKGSGRLHQEGASQMWYNTR